MRIEDFIRVDRSLGYIFRLFTEVICEKKVLILLDANGLQIDINWYPPKYCFVSRTQRLTVIIIIQNGLNVFI